jgi:CheY-like chemotaxis protein
VSNALKFTHDGEVVLQIRKLPCEGCCSDIDAGSVSVEVCDTGVGIGKKEQAMLFQKYQQIQTNLPDTKGTGLGLVIAQRIATLLDTVIEIESPWRREQVEAGAKGGANGGSLGGAGTRFFFTVKNCTATSSSAFSSVGDIESASSGAEEHQHLKEGLKVLVVEDDMLNRMIMRTKLMQSNEFKEAKCVVDEVPHSSDCIAKLDETGINYYDVVVMDEHLGEDSIKGSKLTQQLRTQVKLVRFVCATILMLFVPLTFLTPSASSRCFVGV